MAKADLKSRLSSMLSKAYEDGPLAESAEKMKSGFIPAVETIPLYPAPSSLPILEEPILLRPSPEIVSTPAIAISQANKQTIEQSNNQANNISNKQTINQTDNQTITTAPEQAIEQSYQQFNSHSNNQSSKQTIEQSNNQAHKQSQEQAIEQSYSQFTEQAIEHSERHLIKQTRFAWLPLNENQGRILLFLYERGNGLTNMDIVCEATGIAYGTARVAVDVLIKEGYVTGKQRHNGHAFRGFEYSMNNHLCSLYAARIRGEQSSEQSPWQSINQSSSQAIKQATGQTSNQTPVSLVVSSNINNLTTTATPVDPEFGFWVDEGVTERQLQNWETDFGMSRNELMQSLRYCRYDLLNNPERAEVKSAQNWFFKTVKRAGIYPKPSNYRTLVEIRAEALEKELSIEKEAREKLRAIELDKRFQEIIDNPESQEYIMLFDQLDDFVKGMKGIAQTAALKEIFIKSQQG